VLHWKKNKKQNNLDILPSFTSKRAEVINKKEQTTTLFVETANLFVE
jgi:hypothetical protein